MPAPPRMTPPRHLLCLYAPTANGLWVLIDQDGFTSRLRAWRRSPEGSRCCALLPKRDRDSIHKWMQADHRVSYFAIHCLVCWTRRSPSFWSGAEPRAKLVAPSAAPPPEDEATQTLEPEEVIHTLEPLPDHRVDTYWTVNECGHYYLAPEYVAGFLGRVTELLGPDGTGGGRWTKSDQRLDNIYKWRRGDRVPAKESVLRLATLTQTRLTWLLTGEGDQRSTPPSRAPGEEPKSSPPPSSQPAPYNFFAGCIS